MWTHLLFEPMSRFENRCGGPIRLVFRSAEGALREPALLGARWRVGILEDIFAGPTMEFAKSPEHFDLKVLQLITGLAHWAWLMPVWTRAKDFALRISGPTRYVEKNPELNSRCINICVRP